MPSRPPHKLLKLFAGMLVALLVVVVLGAGYIVYVVESFDTETLPEHYGRVAAELYGSDDEFEGRPLLVGLGGAEGGNAWASRRWQAQRKRFEDAGYAFLAIGYFGLPGTPSKLDRIALEGIQGAIAQAQSKPGVSDRCVVLIGGSKGAELALALAAHDTGIDAVIGLAPADTVFPAHTDAMNTSSWTFNGEPLAFVPIPWAATWDLIRGDLLAVMRRALSDQQAAAEAAIPVERIGGPILLISARDDEMWPAAEMSARLIQRLDAAGFAHPRKHVVVEGGHAAVVDHFSKVEAFLNEEVSRNTDCAPRGAAALEAARRESGVAGM